MTDSNTAVVLSGDRDLEFECPAGLSVSRADPDDVDEEALSDVDAVVVVDDDGVERISSSHSVVPVVACVDDPTGAVATASVVDAVAVDADDVPTRIEWLVARRDRRAGDAVRDRPASSPSRIERLHEGATRLAGVRSTDEAYRTAVAIAEDVFAFHHCTVGVVDGDWIEPIAVSAEVPDGGTHRVKLGTGEAGTAVETGDSRVVGGREDDTAYESTLTVPIGEEAVFQAVSTAEHAFDATDLELAELLASHLEETISRIRATDELRTERDRLLALFENVPDAAVAYDYVDGDPVVRRVNQAFEETFGFDSETVVGESLDDYIVPPNEEAEREAADLNGRLKAGESLRREVTRRTADGPRHFILHVIPIRMETENVSGYAIYTDVTERREREAKLRRQNERLDEFTSIVSHDLRNPLSIAEGYLDLARETGDDDHLERVEDAIDRMDEMVTDLLTLAREGQFVGETEPVDLAALAEDAWRNVETGDADLVVDGDRQVEADPARTRELLENLFRNAVEHGSTGDRSSGVVPETDGDLDDDPDPAAADGGPLTVRVGSVDYRSDGCAGFYVEDDGDGLPEGDADRVFEAGFSTGEDGTGLGLSIARHIAEAHGWEARAMTGQEGGARFEFTRS